MKTFAIVLFSLATVAFGDSTKPSIVLVHGAFADASSWSKVIPILERDGYYVTAVQIPLTSLADGIATSKRVIDGQKGSVVVVGHSYGGVVITGAAAGNSNVKSLVYIDAFAPEANESVSSASAKFGAPPLSNALVPDSAGFLYIDRAKFHDALCKDLPAAEADGGDAETGEQLLFGASVPEAAWKTIPSWFIVSAEDHAINPDLERFYAKRAGAKTTEIKASHVPFLSHPKAFAKVIEDAAR